MTSTRYEIRFDAMTSDSGGLAFLVAVRTTTPTLPQQDAADRSTRDFRSEHLSGLASKLGGGSKKESSSGSSGSAGQEDYLDKGLDALESKFGGGKVDPHSDKMRQTNEKITDGAREQFEKSTGYEAISRVSHYLS
ncbi:hypothetical protein VI817_007208 [Penicillium citrinum]|nr:hypothetical protein VI817_007208 [Penicillium citrinum]